MQKLKKCSWCGQLFLVRNNAQKYCTEECKHEALLESKRKYINSRNLKKHFNTKVKALTTLGSYNTSSTSHSKKTFEEEEKAIKKEKRRLGLRC